MKYCFFTVADEDNIGYAKKMENSLKKFHPDAPLIIRDLAEVRDLSKFYRATPMIARELINEYDLVIKIDADSVVTGSLEHIINDESYDVGCVLNWNRKDPAYTVYDVPPMYYMNCGFVAMRSKEFIDHWWKLCHTPFFDNKRFREQDTLNMIYYFGNYKTKCFDQLSNQWHGLVSKSEWLGISKKGDELVVTPPRENSSGDKGFWYDDKEKVVKVIHFGGGNVPNKMNFDIHFQPEVANYLKELTND